MHFLRGATVAVVSLLAGSALANAPATSPVPSWAGTFLDSWYTAYNNGDAAGVAALFTRDALLGFNNGRAGGSVAMGRAGIEAALTTVFARSRYTCRGSYDGVQQLGTLAVAWGHESCLERPKNSTTTGRTYKRWLRVFALQISDQWAITREESESIQAPETVSPSN
jgi:ketosteroid isomerase-like protein